MWISFKDKKPKIGGLVFTRSPGYENKGDCFEDWRIWTVDILSYSPSPSHWWDGEGEFDKAISCWDKC